MKRLCRRGREAPFGASGPSSLRRPFGRRLRMPSHRIDPTSVGSTGESGALMKAARGGPAGGAGDGQGGGGPPHLNAVTRCSGCPPRSTRLGTALLTTCRPTAWSLHDAGRSAKAKSRAGGLQGSSRRPPRRQRDFLAVASRQDFRRFSGGKIPAIFRRRNILGFFLGRGDTASPNPLRRWSDHRRPV